MSLSVRRQTIEKDPVKPAYLNAFGSQFTLPILITECALYHPTVSALRSAWTPQRI